MSDLDARQLERLRTVFERQRAAFAAEPMRPLDARRDDLAKLERAVLGAAEAVADAISTDFGTRSRTETIISEVNFVAENARHARKHLRRWARRRSVATPLILQPGRAYVQPTPKGVAGVVAPWNYPFQLALAPVVGALAAGCRVIIKPAELAPATSSLIERLIADTFAEDHVAVITGGPAVSQAVCALPLDHLLFTGSTRVGRLVAEAAARNLTPVTLELGGKSPAIVTEGYPLARAGASIAWGRLFNAGQTCIAVDHVLAPRAEMDGLVDAVLAAMARQHPEPASDPDYTAIIAQSHYDRFAAMLEEARAAGVALRQPPHDPDAMKAARKIPPTIAVDPPAELAMMREEVFGPILPVIPYDRLEDAIDHVNAGDRPLALYVFSKDRAQIRRVLDATISGGAAVNAPFLQMSVADLPFGGVGASGYGSYHGEAGFRAFSHERAVFDAPAGHPSRLLAPPYGRFAKLIAKLQTRL